MVEMRFSCRITSASSSTASAFSGAVMKYGERKPRSKRIPSTISSAVSVPLASSTLTMPSAPTRSIALATMRPISLLPCAEMVATCSRSRVVVTGREMPRSASTAVFTPRSSPRFKSIALAPATTLRTPSAKIACASRVEVVVPSPTDSPVRTAASRSICTPRFSSGSGRSMRFAIVTPSSHTIGSAYLRWIRIDFERGPSVTRTASASAVAPARIFPRASSRNRMRV